MHGDFSRWALDEHSNFNGILHQQGRVLLDADTNHHTRIVNRWQDTAARSAFGPRIAAVPQDQQNSFRVSSANHDDAQVTVSLEAGTVWADGLLAFLQGDEAHTVPYLAPPIVDASVDAPGAGDRDAVILEIWREAVNGFQVPDALIEPALGGPDTSERLFTSFRFRLVRLLEGEDCEEAVERIQDDLDNRGHLTVSLQAREVEEGPCPVVDGGGYTGFEHNLYRIEIADVDASSPHFKWSSFNGGLVGRAEFETEGGQLFGAIRGNGEAIRRSGLQEFYLEVVEPRPPRTEDAARRAEYWEVVAGARATLVGDRLEIGAAMFGSIPQGRNVFFRLWNGIDQVSSFLAGSPEPLRDGIRLEFDPPASETYVSGDYWVFPVRAGEVGNPDQQFPTDAPPEGIRRHRVALAELHWGAGPAVAEDDIIDCRKVFPPLTDPTNCCVPIAPGGNLQRAIERIRDAGGGCLCLLPGVHVLREPLDFSNVSNIRLEGFGLASRIELGRSFQGAAAFILNNARNIDFRSLAVVNRTRAVTWAGTDAEGIRIDRVFAYAVYRLPKPHIATSGLETKGWELEDNIFLGPATVSGQRLSRGHLRGNICINVLHAIDISSLLDVRIEENDFIGITPLQGIGVDTSIQLMLSESEPADFQSAITQLVNGLVTGEAATVSDDFIALRCSSLLDVTFVANEMRGGTGMSAELVEGCEVSGNRFHTTTFGATFAIVHDLLFAHNRVGQVTQRGQKPRRRPTIGLRVIVDAVDCRIIENAFLGVQTGIAFTSDRNGVQETLADFSTRLIRRTNASREESEGFLAAAQAGTENRRAHYTIASNSFFALGESNRVLIRGNVIDAVRVGIEWSGTRLIQDFRIVRNAFSQCQDVAVLVEPDDRVFVLSQTLDTRVRLVEKNRFEIQGVAVRSTIGALRVANNDIHVTPRDGQAVNLSDAIDIISRHLYRSADALGAANDQNDVPGMRVFMGAAQHRLDRAPSQIENDDFGTNVENRILMQQPAGGGDALADSMFIMKGLADMGANSLVAAYLGEVFPKTMLPREGFVINLKGRQNRIIENRLHSTQPRLSGGVLINAQSGDVCGNDIVVATTGLLISPLRQRADDMRVERNTIRTVGQPQSDGRRRTPFALSISTLVAGSLSILDNRLEGSVMVGADPLSALGLHEEDTFVLINTAVAYNPMKYDGRDYIATLAYLADPLVFAPPQADPQVIGILVAQVWDNNPHRNRPIVQFSNNRVVRGYVAIAQSTAGALWTEGQLASQANRALIATVSGNVFDYLARIVGRDLVLVGNHSQTGLQYRAGFRSELSANIPAATPF